MQGWRQEGMYTLQKEMREGIFNINNDDLTGAFRDSTKNECVMSSHNLILNMLGRRRIL